MTGYLVTIGWGLVVFFAFMLWRIYRKSETISALEAMKRIGRQE